MKRSEMVTHVIKTLYPNDIEISLYEQNRISKILKIIEDAGMLPPCTGYKNKHIEDVGYYEWEEE